MLTRLATLGDLSPLRSATRGEVFQVRTQRTQSPGKERVLRISIRALPFSSVSVFSVSSVVRIRKLLGFKPFGALG